MDRARQRELLFMRSAELAREFQNLSYIIQNHTENLTQEDITMWEARARTTVQAIIPHTEAVRAFLLTPFPVEPSND